MSNRKQLAESQLQIMRAYRGLFLTEDGQLNPDAQLIMRDLEKECGASMKKMPTIKDGSIDPLSIVENFAKTAVFRHIKERLFADLIPLKRATETDN